jgi:hypothetical protein
MATIKTAISIDKSLFEAMGDLSHEMNISRSRIFALAAAEFVQRHKNLKLLEAINAAYNDFTDENESSINTVMRSKYLKMVKEQW